MSNGGTVDNSQLTERLRKELRVKTSRGVSSPTSIKPVAGPTLDNSLWKNAQQRNQTPDWYTPTAGYREPTDDTLMNALGALTWSFVDSASFGLADWLAPGVGELIDKEDPLAKWFGAFGGFAGFVAGAPMKIVGKGVQKGIMFGLGKSGALGAKKSADEVIRAARRIGKRGGLTRKQTKTITEKYRGLVTKAQIDPILKGQRFSDDAMKLVDDYVANGILRKEITKAEGEVFKKMFKVGGKTLFGRQTSNLLTRPIQDITGIMYQRGLGVTHPKLAKWIGHAVRDVSMFPVIDGIFEGVASHKDGRDFDWSAPMWGAINGLAFSQLSWLNPAGKAKNFKADFLTGARAAFGKDIYKNKTPGQMSQYANFWGQQLKRTPKDGGVGNRTSVVNIEYGGKTGSVKLTSEKLPEQLKAAFGKDGDKALKSYLRGHLKKQGKAMMRGISADELHNFKASWLRMAVGGALFNTHTFYEMFMHDAEAGVNDILPHFLIGAWLQRGSNPARFDMNSGEMNQLRRNLYTLGVDPSTLSKIPTFDGVRNRHLSLFNDSKYDKLKQKAIDEGVISDSPEVTNERLPDNKVSVEMSTEDPVFTLVYESLLGHKTHRKYKGDISKETADKLVNLAKKISPELKDSKEVDRILQESVARSTEGFEKGFVDIIDHIRLNDDANILGITSGQINGRQVLNVPKTLIVDQALLNKAREGKLEWLVDAEGKKITDPDLAESTLMEKVDGFNMIIKTTHYLETTNPLPIGSETKIVGIEKYGKVGENLIRNVYEKVSQSEKDINDSFPLRNLNADKFTYLSEAADYMGILKHNNSVKFAKDAVKIFGVEFPDREKLIPFLQRAGIFTDAALTGEAKLVPDSGKIKIKKPEGVTDEQAENDINEAQRFLNRVLTLQKIEGSKIYKQATLDEANKVKTTLTDIDNLKNKLASYGYDVDKIPEYLHEQLTYFAARNLVKGTNLSIEQTEALFNLKEFGLADFGAGERGRGVGFMVRLIDESIAPVGLKDTVREYNILVRKAVKDSNGLAIIDAEQTIVDPSLIKFAHEVVDPLIKDQSYSGRAKLLEFLNLLDHDSKDNGAFQHQVDRFIKDDPTNIARLQKWLVAADVLKVGEGHKRDAMIDITKLAEKAGVELTSEFEADMTIQEMLTQRMNAYGIDAKHSEMQFKMREQNARNKMIEDSNDSSFDDNIRLSDFYNRYRIDGTDLSKTNIKEQNENFKELIYHDKDNKILKWGVLNSIINDRIYVKSGDNFRKFKNLSQEEQNKRRAEITGDIVGLLAQQKAQTFVDVITWVNGKSKRETQVIQIGRFYKLMGKIGVPYVMVDPRVSVYEATPDGRYHNRIFVDMFGNTSNLSEANRRRIRDARIHIENTMSTKGTDLDNPQGIYIMRPMPNMEPIALEPKDFGRVNEAFKVLADEYGNLDTVAKGVQDTINKLRSSLESDSRTPAEVSSAMSLLVSKEMLTGTDGNKLFIDFLNGKVDNEKLMARTRLFNTKNFIMGDESWAAQVADAYKETGDINTSNKIRKFLRKRGKKSPHIKYVAWNDDVHGNLKTEVEKHIKDKGIKGWEWGKVIGDAHNDVTSFDSQTYVSRDMMTYLHAIIGHDPKSRNPLKPILSSGGEGGSLLLGKTLFMYSPDLDSFFKLSGVDMMVAKSAIKAINPVGEEPGRDPTLLNVPWQDLTGYTAGPTSIRTMPLSAIGLKSEKDYKFNSAKNSQADYNYMNNKESSKVYDEVFDRLDKNVETMIEIAQDPIQMRAFITKELGDRNLWNELAESEGGVHLSNMVMWASLTRHANPMSYSDSIVKNKMYNMFIDNLINNSRSVTNQFEKNHSARYGGSTYLVQIPVEKWRARPTLVNEKGEKIQHGEVLLPSHERDMSLSELFNQGMEIRFINNDMVMTPEKALGEYWELFQTGKDVQTLGHLYDYLEVLKTGEDRVIHENTQIGIVVRRNPRTRPNDMAMLGLKDFLSEEHGNAMSINSFDVANIFEGDYDADKSDYWFAHNKNFYNHVQRSSNFYVQGVDPSSWIPKSKFHWAQSPEEISRAIEVMAADMELYKSSIGRVQKVARKLGYMQKLGGEMKEGNLWFDGYNKNNPLSLLSNKSRMLLGGNENDNFAIVLDYDHTDYYQRAALETQYIIDGARRINPDISRDIDTWADRFLFPEKEGSVTLPDASKKGNDLINNMRRDGNIGDAKGSRIRIFRKLVYTKGEYTEQDLSALDKAMLKEMLGEYGRFLNVTGDSMFEKTGESKGVGYEQVHDATERFRLFNNNITNNLYQRLRNRYVNNDKTKGKWWKDREFQKVFGSDVKEYTDTFGKKKKFYTWTNEVINNTAKNHGTEFFNGTRGAPVDRILSHLSIADPFERGRNKTVGADMNKLMNDWYLEVLNGANVEEAGDAIGRMTNRVREASQDINYKINTIASMKKKMMQIKGNEGVPYKVRRASMDKISKIIEEIEKEITPMIPAKYWKTRKSSDLQRIEYVNVSKENVKEGAIHYSTMATLRELLPFGAGRESFGLNTKGVELLNEIKSARKLFYGNQTSLKDVLKYGDKTLLTTSMRRYLENLPDVSTAYEIEEGLLQKGYNEHGPAFIYSFMMPAQNKYAVGVFRGKPVAVPFQATNMYNPSSRYRRGVKFLTGVAAKTTEIGWDADLTKGLLGSLQQVEAQWHRFFNEDVGLKNLLMGKIGEESNIGEGLRLNMGDLRLPKFSEDFQKSFVRHGDIKWTRNAGRVNHGRNIMNDYLLSFYRDILHIAGKEKEFDSYLNQMHDLQALMIQSETIDPIKYLSIRSQMGKEVREVAQKVFSGGLDKNNKYVRNMMKNPVYTIMGGPEYFRGYALEKESVFNPERLRTIKRLSNSMEELRDEMDFGSERFKRKFEELENQCP